MSEWVIKDDVAERNLELTRISVAQGEYGELSLDLAVEGRAPSRPCRAHGECRARSASAAKI